MSYSLASSLSANATDNELEKQILEKLKQEKVKQKNIEKEEQESQGGLLGFVTSVFSSSDKEAEAAEPGTSARTIRLRR